MTLSRKDFFRQGFFSLGETLLQVGGNVQELQGSLCLPVDDAEHDKEPVPGENMVARVHNQHCLAKNCGCFSCVERCAAGAIDVIIGVGLRIDAALCSGCGTCEYVCPVTPKAMRIVPRGC